MLEIAVETNCINEPAADGPNMATAATAFVPGHLTVFFSPQWRDDPARTGSTGAGLALSDGVSVTFDPAPETTVSLNGEPIAVEPVGRLLASLGTTGRVSVESPLPLGEGFGVSGAMTLGTALAANQALVAARTENELITLAHVAEVQSNTGLGDVVAQARGGVPIRLVPGAPGNGVLDGIPAAASLEYCSFGELSTAEVITDDITALQAAGDRALDAVRDRPTLATLFDVGRRFARDADLLTSRVDAAIEAVQETGGEATMGMLGETVVALGSGLSDAGYDATACEIHAPGAALTT